LDKNRRFKSGGNQEKAVEKAVENAAGFQNAMQEASTCNV